MALAIKAAGFTPGEADQLRRSMATFRLAGGVSRFKAQFIDGMVANGYDCDLAERTFRMIEGFGSYGFPESHSASFARLVYASAWMKCRFPDVFLTALLNAQPMGFYAPAQLVRDAREHGIEVRPVDVNHSRREATLEPLGDGASKPAGRLHEKHADMAGVIRSRFAVRVGLAQVQSLREADAEMLVATRERLHEARREHDAAALPAFDSVRHLWLTSGLGIPALEHLAEADAFRSLGLDRRHALWAVKGLAGAGALNKGGRESTPKRLPLLDRQDAINAAQEPEVALPAMPLGAHVVSDYRHLGLSLKAHLIRFVRSALSAQGYVPASRLKETRSGATVSVAGLVLVRQRPGSAKGTMFITIKDETEVTNLIVWPVVFETFRPTVLGSRLLGVHGPVQKSEGVIHVVARRMENLSHLLGLLNTEDLATAADATAEAGVPAAVMPKGRNFR